MTDHRNAWMFADVMIGAACVLTGYLPLQIIGTLVLAACMILPIAMTNEVAR